MLVVDEINNTRRETDLLNGEQPSSEEEEGCISEEEEEEPLEDPGVNNNYNKAPAVPSTELPSTDLPAMRAPPPPPPPPSSMPPAFVVTQPAYHVVRPNFVAPQQVFQNGTAFIPVMTTPYSPFGYGQGQQQQQLIPIGGGPNGFVPGMAPMVGMHPSVVYQQPGPPMQQQQFLPVQNPMQLPPQTVQMHSMHPQPPPPHVQMHPHHPPVQMHSHVPPVQPRYNRPPPPPPPPIESSNVSSSVPPRGNSQYYCEVCDRNLWTADRLEMHLIEDHVVCDFDDCEWSGPPALLHTHKISHIRDTSGVPVAKSQTETEAWLVARKRTRCRKRGLDDSSLPQIPTSELEKYLREGVMNHNNNKKQRVSSKIAAGGVIPQSVQYVKAFESKRAEALGGPETGGGKQQQRCRLWQEFDICDQFLRTKKCRFGDDCVHSHDIKRYQEWQINRLKSGLQVKMKSSSSAALIYKLHESEIIKYEDVLMQVFSTLAENNFFLNEEKHQVLSLEDCDLISSSSESSSAEGSDQEQAAENDEEEVRSSPIDSAIIQ